MNDIGLWLFSNSWLLVGSFSGSMCAMFAARNLTLAGRLQTLVVGTLAGCFAGPFICEVWFKQYDPMTSRVPAFVCFITGAVALSVIPIVIKRAKDFASRVDIKILSKGPTDDNG